MQRYILRRLALTIPAILGVTLLVSAMVRLLPGDAVALLLQDNVGTAKDADELRAKLGLNKPFHTQYLS
jgi:peptide/nickel transport system permease protein